MEIGAPGAGFARFPCDSFLWMAGSEEKKYSHVATNDFHATILHLMGLDHEKLTYRYSGRDYRLTDVSGRVIRELIA